MPEDFAETFGEETESGTWAVTAKFRVSRLIGSSLMDEPFRWDCSK